ncbi:MAG: hypothetical protein Q9209_001342 [Squamulea sp. 1 TL-2023]
MDDMDIDTIGQEAARETLDSRARHLIGGLDRPATKNMVLVVPRKTDLNGSTIDGHGNEPEIHIRPVPPELAEISESTKYLIPNNSNGQGPWEMGQEVGRQYGGMKKRVESLAAPASPAPVHLSPNPASPAPASPSEDELLEGEVAWAMPITQPRMLPTGLCYDVRMRYHCELDPPKQRLDFHPEDPRRIYHIYRELCQAGLYKDPQFNVPIIDKPLERIPARNATAPEICLVHTANHYNSVASTAAMTDESLIHLERMYDSIYFNKLTFSSALLSAGGAIETCKAVVSGRFKNAIAVIRPPGHHAECNRPMGFCLFDNVSIAAKVCQADYSEACRKVLILDWDVHHGNGIQQAFEQDPNVLYISIHVHEDGNFYPPGPYGDHMHCGAGPGLGKNINIPWPTKGMGDADYLYAFQQVVMPVAYDFDPDLVIIAAGFDAAIGDQLGGCFVTPTCYAHMAHMLMPLAKGKLVVCLEGGYNLASISKSALAVTRTLLGEPPDRIADTRPTKSGAATVDMVRVYQRRFWPCLALDSKTNTKDALRAYQKQQLCDEFDMMELSVYRERISKSFKHQVLATTNYADAVPLIVFFHDPYHHQTGQDPNMRRLADAELDIDELNYDKDFETAKRSAERNELAIYLWENYIELNDSTSTFFMGVGSPAKEIVHILNNRETFFQRITGIILFLDSSNPLPSVSDQNTYYLSKWFKQNSLVFVSGDHAQWAGDGANKKPSKRFGGVRRSEVEGGVNDMLEKHREEVVEFVGARMGGGRGR